ncbi:MAG: hypothetical protein JO165_13455, partial [Candidatus Eremiobacteraeota bacterium]|nr:hypothetical protein [Candidatus Eremiobacteraeota bacterium]
LRPMTGTRSRFAALHIGGSSAILAGIVIAEIGVLGGWPALAFSGFIVGAIGALAYLIDLADVFRRATTPHVQPQLLMVFGALCSFVAMLVAASAMLGKDVGAAAVYVALIGWVGSAVIAHLHHLGVRLLLTIVRGDDDETRPWEVLTPHLTWLTVALYIAAVVLGALALNLHHFAYLEIAAICGILAWIVMVVNVTRAYRVAQSQGVQSHSLV